MKLLEFPHSHYCEKARWALDHKQIPYERVSVMPGRHLQTIGRIAPDTSVPVLLDRDVVIQGSSAIIDYLDRDIPGAPPPQGAPLTPRDPEERKRCRALEGEFDAVFGVNLRRALYFHLLPHSAFVRHCFMSRSSRWEQLQFTVMYRFMRNKVEEKYAVTQSEVERGLAEMGNALDYWDGVLLPGEYLVGGRFTRADLSLSSMLYFVGLPSEFESPWPVNPPNSQAEEMIQSLKDRPTLHWVEHIYRTHRVEYRPAHRRDPSRLIVL
jgi:glutathione S-transferase